MSGIGYNASSPEEVRDAFCVLRTAAEEGRLAHGYVLSCAKTEWGIALSDLVLQWLFCDQPVRPCGECRACRLIAARGHPDAVWVEPESKSRVISIDQIRNLNHFIRQTSFEGGWKSAVLLDAHRLNESAANAFLKTLEEPPPRCLLLLVTDSPQSLLPTILSRCQHVPLGDHRGTASFSPVETAMLEWLRNRSGAETGAEQSAWIGAILREIREAAELEEKERAGEEDENDVIEARVQSRVVGARIEVLRTLFQWERDMMACAGGADPAHLYYPSDAASLRRQSREITLAGCMDRLDRVERARRLLEGNVPENSVWEAVLPV